MRLVLKRRLRGNSKGVKLWGIVKGSNFALCHVSGRRSVGVRPRIVELLGPEDSRLDIVPAVARPRRINIYPRLLAVAEVAWSPRRT